MKNPKRALAVNFSSGTSDLIGAYSAEADAEMIAIAAGFSSKAAGLTSQQVDHQSPTTGA